MHRRTSAFEAKLGLAPTGDMVTPMGKFHDNLMVRINIRFGMRESRPLSCDLQHNEDIFSSFEPS